MGGFLFGFDTSVINGAIDAMSEDFAISGFMQGFAVSSALLGCVAGAWFSGPLAARFGRVKVMLVAAVLFLVSAIGSGLAFGVIDLIVWRVLGGLAVGAASVIAPAYIAEVAPAQVRGRLGSLQQLAIVLGIFAALLSDAFLAGQAGGAAETLWLGREAWRWMFMAEAVPAVLYGALALAIPESPRFLVDKGRVQEATRILRDYTKVKDTAAKIDEITRSLARESAESLRDLRGASFGLKPIMWVMLGEMFPNTIRATAVAVASAFNWLANFTVSTTLPVLSETSLTLAYGLYAAFALISFFFVLRAVPETTGRELEDMSEQARGAG